MTFERSVRIQVALAIAVLAITMLSAACQPLFVAQQEQEFPITIENLTGVWLDRYGAYTQFYEDGTFRAAESLGGFDTLPWDWGTFQLQESQLTLINDERAASALWWYWQLSGSESRRGQAQAGTRGR